VSRTFPIEYTVIAWRSQRCFKCRALVSASATAEKPGNGSVFPAPGEPRVIHFDDHTTLTLPGTSYGYHHKAPHFENLGTANWIYTPPSMTVVWIQENHEPGRRPSYELLVSDRAEHGLRQHRAAARIICQ
jgi:hypothetical protein